MNCVGSSGGRFIELQATAEQAPFSRGEFDRLLDLAASGLDGLFALQQNALALLVA